MQIEKARDKVSGLELIDTCWDVNKAIANASFTSALN